MCIVAVQRLVLVVAGQFTQCGVMEYAGSNAAFLEDLMGVGVAVQPALAPVGLVCSVLGLCHETIVGSVDLGLAALRLILGLRLLLVGSSGAGF